MTGDRSLDDSAKRGMKLYHIALAFSHQKWDATTNKPKVSGDILESVSEFVCTEMSKATRPTNVMVRVNNVENNKMQDEKKK